MWSPPGLPCEPASRLRKPGQDVGAEGADADAGFNLRYPKDNGRLSLLFLTLRDGLVCCLRDMNDLASFQIFSHRCVFSRVLAGFYFRRSFF